MKRARFGGIENRCIFKGGIVWEREGKGKGGLFGAFGVL